MSRLVQRDKARKVEEIKRAFRELVSTKEGYGEVTVRQIARKANVSTGLVYHYFPSGKPSIAATIYKENYIDTIIPYAFLDNPQEIEKSIKSHLDNHRKHISLYRTFDQALFANQEAWKGLKSERNDMFRNYATEHNYPANKIDAWLLACSTIDAIVHRHLILEKICDSDKEFIKLIRIVYSSILTNM